MLMQNFGRKAAFNKLPASLVLSILHGRMFSSCSSTTMCLLVMMIRPLRAFGAKACSLMLLWILHQLGLVLMDTRVACRIYHKVVHLLGWNNLVPNINRLMLLIEKISWVGSTICCLRYSRNSIPLFCGTRHTTTPAFSQGRINRLRVGVCSIRIWWWLTHYDPAACLRGTSYIAILGAGICRNGGVVNHYVADIYARRTSCARNAWSANSRSSRCKIMLLLVFLHLCGCLIARTCSNIDIVC